MKLDEWIFRKKITIKKFSDEIKIAYVVCQYIISRAGNIKVNLINALKIVRYTDGEVSLEDLLDDATLEEVKSIVPYNQK